MKCSRCGNELKPDDKFCPSCGAPVSAEPKEPSGRNTASLLKRAFLFLEDGSWAKADEYCERVLDEEPDCAQAYLGKLMAELGVRKQEDLANLPAPFDGRNNYQKVLRFGDDALSAELQRCNAQAKARNEYSYLDNVYSRALAAMQSASTEPAFLSAAGAFETIPQYKDARALAAQCRESAETSRKDAIYAYAVSMMNSGKEKHWHEAISAFQTIPGWRNVDLLIGKCEKKIAAYQAEKEAKRKRAKKRTMIIGIVDISLIVIAAVLLLVIKVIIPNSKYNAAVHLYNAGKYDEAIAAFEAMDGYKDSADQVQECKYSIAEALYNAGKYEEAIAAFTALGGYKDSATQVQACKYIIAENLLNSGDAAHAAIAFGNLGDYSDAKARCAALWEALAERQTIAAGGYHTVGLKSDGTVVAVGWNDDDQCDVSGWTDIVAISAGHEHTVGLKSDGTVVAVGYNGDGECDVSGWTDIVAIAAGVFHTVGLKSDGTVVAVGSGDYHVGQCDVSGWTDIVAIAAGEYHTVGLKSDGTVVAVGYNGDGECDVSGWTDIPAISAGVYHTVGLKSDGTVVAVGENDDGRCDVSGWTDIVAISAGRYHTVGLKSDGTVVAVGDNDYGQCDVSGWRDIVAISAGWGHTVGLKSDGTVVAVGWNDCGQCDVSGWRNIKLPN